MKDHELNSITIPGSFACLAKVRSFIAKAAKEAGINDDGIDDIIIAVDEACSNIIEHNYKEDRGKNIRISFNRKRNDFVIKIEDEGRKFDVKKHKSSPHLNRHIKELKSRGMGIFLIKKLMDNIGYSHIKSKGNCLTLKKKIKHAKTRD